ncbi:MAG: TetR/AcrR family transcriptional regulator [Acidimicrobiia bacterium]
MAVSFTDERRLRILDAAAAVLTANPRASLAEVAGAAGMGRTTIHRYFPGRHDLLVALADDALESIEQAIAAARPGEGSAVDAMARIAAAVLPLADRFRFLEQGPEVWDVEDLDERWSSLAEVLDGIVDRGKRTGEIRAAVPTSLVTEVFAGALWAVGEAVSDGRVAAADAVPGLVAILGDGLRPGPHGP